MSPAGPYPLLTIVEPSSLQAVAQPSSLQEFE